MPVWECPINGCDYKTPDTETENGAIALMNIHGTTHVVTPAPVAATPPPARDHERDDKLPSLDRPKISQGSSEETWINFKTRWDMFKLGERLSVRSTLKHLFQCCDESLGNAVLKASPDAATGTEAQLLEAIKQLAVTPSAITVRRSAFLNCKQDHNENARAFFTRLKGKAATCPYTKECASANCHQLNDVTELILKDVFIDGLADDDIKLEVLGWAELDDKSLADTV